MKQPFAILGVAASTLVLGGIATAQKPGPAGKSNAPTFTSRPPPATPPPPPPAAPTSAASGSEDPGRARVPSSPASAPPSPPSTAPKASRFQWLKDYTKTAKQANRLVCPSTVTTSQESSFAPPTFTFERASVEGSCSTTNDLAPVAERGGPCAVCSYKNGLQLRRSAGKQKSCWVHPEIPTTVVCENVPPLPPSQTCRFDIQLPTISLYPLDHLSGDNDLWSEGSLFTYNSTTVNIDVAVLRGSGPERNKLFLSANMRLSEFADDHTTFGKSQVFEIQNAHLKAGSVNDIETCLKSFGANRPFVGPNGSFSLSTRGEGWDDFPATWSSGAIRFSSHCRTDDRGSDIGAVGCNSIKFDPISVYLR